MERAAALGMVTPDYVYIMISERVDDLIRRPWGDRPEGMSDSQWQARKDLFKYMMFVSNTL